MATVMLRQTTVSSVSKLLRQSQIRVIRFSSEPGEPKDPEEAKIKLSRDPKDPEEAKKKLSSLLSSIKAQPKPERKVHKEPKLAQPMPGALPKRDKAGKIVAKQDMMSTDLGIDSDELKQATRRVARLAKNERAAARTESDLMKKLKSIAVEAESAKSEDLVSGEKTTSLLSDMNVEISKRKPDRPLGKLVTGQGAQRQVLSAEQQAFLENRARLRREKAGTDLESSYVPTDLFGSTPLGIFDGPIEPVPEQDQMLQTWRKCSERELSLLSTKPPRNALEEFILWTEQGKLWKFPIDNEQGLDYSEEKFHQHVFLEQHLNPWCPKGGPIRHFMETVCVALSKNPYASVQYKLDTIDWFRQYFNRPEVNEILVHQGAWLEASQ